MPESEVRIGMKAIAFEFETDGGLDKHRFSLDIQSVICLGWMSEASILELQKMCRQIGFFGIYGPHRKVTVESVLAEVPRRRTKRDGSPHAP